MAYPNPKHARYGPQYQRWDLYWGLGVEHETYLMTSQRRRVTALEGVALRPERYSVDYFRNYRSDVLPGALAAVLADGSGGGGLVVPVLVNGHSFTHCDVFGEHQTTYERSPKPNPRYSGKRMWDWVCERSVWLRDELDRAYQFDGDTIEFITQDFYRATVAGVVAELEATETRFVRELAGLPRTGILAAYAPLVLAAPRNEPFATYLTAPRSVAMFNNGTIHVNVTLPTRLGWDRRPLWPALFLEEHRALARLIQWMEPLWIATVGSGDPFAARDLSGARFAAGSQRLAVSRYIGVGTFDTETMTTGKVLQLPRPAVGVLPWYDWLLERTGYTRLDFIGLDLNYNKHWSHGLEIRIFDQMPMAALRGVLEQVVVLCDVARTRVAGGRVVADPRRDRAWQEAAGSALLEGAGWRVAPEYVNAFCTAIGVGVSTDDQKEPMTVSIAMEAVMAAMRAGSGDGYCQRVMGSGAGSGVGGGSCGCYCM